MSSERSGNPLDPVRKANEEEYFRKQNADAAAKLKARAAMSQAGIHDEGLALKLKEAGFNEDTLRALYLIPLLDVAWADGKVQIEEKNQILSVLKTRGIDASSGAYQLVKAWVEKGPAEESFQRGKALVSPLLDDLKKGGSAAGEWILQASERVAHATGGLFGLGSKVSGEEAKILSEISKKLK